MYKFKSLLTGFFLIAAAIVVLAVTCGCTSYVTNYQRYLVESNNPPKSLQFKDTVNHIEFSFQPDNNGTYFSIKNLRNGPCFLEWDRCYFIDPYGNSSKALNTDIIHESSETKDKERYESILPPQASFGRFTTSVLNLNRLINIKFNEINNHFTMNVNRVDLVECYKYPVYSDSDAQIPTCAAKKLKLISDFVMSNNNMRLGLGIKLSSPDTTIDYKFDFRFKSVSIYKISKHSNNHGMVRDTALFKSALEENNWQWK